MRALVALAQRDMVGWAGGPSGTDGWCVLLRTPPRRILSPCSPGFSVYPHTLSGYRYEGDYLITHDLGNSFIRMPLRFSWRQVSRAAHAAGL